MLTLRIEGKIGDCGYYTIKENTKIISEFDGYVPTEFGVSSDGDMIDLEINEDGLILNWKKLEFLLWVEDKSK